MRLQKIISLSGIASRREAERMITAGRVSVNGVVVSTLGTKADIQNDLVEVDGRPVSPPEKKVYYLLYKPAGFITTMKDPRGRPTVRDLAGKTGQRVFPVGRLDYDVSGLIIMTNDGEMANGLAHPKKEVKKRYQVKVNGIVSKETLKKLSCGIKLTDGLTAPARAKLIGTAQNSSWIELTIHEGRNRQVKRMCKAVGHRVEKLKRVGYGPLSIGDMKPGELRKLSPEEVSTLRALAGGGE